MASGSHDKCGSNLSQPLVALPEVLQAEKANPYPELTDIPRQHEALVLGGSGDTV